MTFSLPKSPQSSFRRSALSTRHNARELGLQILFQWDFHGQTEPNLEEFWRQRPVAPDVKTFAETLVHGVQRHCQELDRLLSQHATNWTVERMPVVDRNILRQALFELLFLPDVPAKVTVNEALQLTKSFADEESRRFVNGVLDAVLKSHPALEDKRKTLDPAHSSSLSCPEPQFSVRPEDPRPAR